MKSFNDSEEPTSLSAPDVQKVAQTKPYPQFFSWPPFWFFTLFSLAVCAVSYAAFLRYASDTRQEELKLLATIANLKVDEITRWRKEREGDAEVFARAPLFVRTFGKWLQQGAPQDENRQAFIERMRLTQRAYGYREVILFDARGQPILSTTSGAPLPAARTMELVKRAMQTQTAIPLDINSSDVADSLDVIMPIISGNRTIGAAYLRTDTSRFLFPLLKAAPSDHESMELVLVRREGDEVLFLNIPAVNKEAGLLRQPLNKSKLPSAMAAAGMQGEVEGVDYKGVPVFAALRKIPASDWALVAKVNREEIYAPLRNTAWLVAGAIAALIALSGLAVSLWWRNQRAETLLTERKRAEEILKQSEEKFRVLVAKAQAGIVVHGADTQILLANSTAQRLLGLSEDQLLGKTVIDPAWHFFREDGTVMPLEEYPATQVFASRKPLRNFIVGVHQSEQGYNPWVLVNVDPVFGEEDELVQVIVTFIDITARKQAEEALAQERLFLDTLLDNIAEAVVSCDDQGILSRFNQAARELHGLPERPVTPEQWAEYYDLYQADGKTPLRMEEIPLFRALQGERVRDAEMVVIPKGGTAHFLLASGQAMRDPGGKLLGAVVTMHDITARKRAEEALQQAQMELLEAQRIAHVGSWWLDVATNHVVWSDELYRMLGLNPGLPPPDYTEHQKLFTPESWERLSKALPRTQETGVPYELDLEMVKPDGSHGWMWARGEVVRDANNDVVGLHGVAMDITARKQAEEMLRRIEWMLVERPAEAFPDAVDQTYGDLTRLNTSRVILDAVGPQLLADIDGSFIHLLETSSAIYEKNGDYAFGIFASGWCKFMDMASRQLCATPDNREALCGGKWLCHESCWNEASRKSIETGAPADIECAGGIHLYALPIRAGDEIIGSINVGYGDPPKDAARLQELADKYGVSFEELRREAEAYQTRPPFIIEVAKRRLSSAARLIGEIVLRKHTEEKIRQLNNELERRVVERTAQLEAANSDMEGFSYSVSHDLRAPLRAIDGFSHILLEDYAARLDDEGRRLLNIVGNNARKMGELIDDILMFSRTTRQEVKRSEINMESMVRDIWEELKQEMAGRNVQLELRDMPPVEGDAAMLRQVVFNLLANAVKFTKHNAGARIEVGGEANEHEVVYHVKDNGAGFNMQYAEKLFGVFHRLHGVDDFEGTGIGLAIVKRIITKHGGRVWAEGKPNEGATFYFALPKR